MKIFCAEYPLLSGRDAGSSGPVVTRLFMRGDSALSNSGKTLARPWWIERLSAVPVLAVRVGRVGKHFSTGDARKYYREGAVGVSFAGADFFREVSASGGDPSAAYNFDGALHLSPFFPMEECPPVLHLFRYRSGERLHEEIPVSVRPEEIDALLSEISAYYLLKMGDMVTIPLVDAFEEVTADERRVYEDEEGRGLLNLGIRLFRGNFKSLLDSPFSGDEE